MPCRISDVTAASGSVGQVVGQQLDRDRPIQLRVERAVDDAHAARAEGSLNLIPADSMANWYRRAGIAHEAYRGVVGMMLRYRDYMRQLITGFQLALFWSTNLRS